VLPWLAAEAHDLFNAYQRAHGTRVEKVMEGMIGTGFVASFIGMQAGRATFVGLYAITGGRRVPLDDYWQLPENQQLKDRGMGGWTGDGRPTIMWFDLERSDFYSRWSGRLIIDWPPPERSWWRRSHKNDMAVAAILEANAFVAQMPRWDDISLSWDELRDLPREWKAALEQWRGVYFLFDTSDGKGYVGSACGATNILGRWLSYAATGHGGNRLLINRDPRHFRFAILQRVSPDMPAEEVIALETSWKQRLQTRVPFGLNDN
jgi:hypothetical protein